MTSWNSTKWLISYMRAHPWQSLFVIFTSIIEPVFYLIPLFISADIVGILLDGGGWANVWQIFKILIPISIFQVVLFFFSSFINEILAHRISTDMTADLFEELQGRSLSYHDSKDVGDIMARASNDTRTVNMGLSPGIRILVALFSIWFTALFVLYITLPPIVSIVGIVVLAIFLYLTVGYGRRVEPLSTQALEELAEISGITNDSLVGIRDVKTYTAEHVVKTKFAKKVYQQAMTKENEGRIGAWFYPSLLARTYILVVVGISLVMVFQGAITIRDVVLVASIMAVATGMSDEMNWISFLMVGTLAANNRLYNYIQEEDRYQIEDGSRQFDASNASIEFSQVSFSYPSSENPVINNISFKIEDSQTLAIVGSPGAGKSTLTKLIQRLYLPNEGRIIIGNYPLEEYTTKSLSKHIATVEQDIHLFNDTLTENIKFGKPEATQEDVIKMAKIAQAHDFIQSFPDGYDTIIGEDGVRLSGGQAQRIAIARALMMNPEILIVDDGASALDAKTEKLIQDAIADILKTRTTIITTHRLAIIAEADKILILDKGEVVGYGSHERLIKMNQYYRNLFSRHYELPTLEEFT